MVLGYFLGLELQKLLIGCLSGAFIYEFLKSHKILSRSSWSVNLSM